MGTPNVAVPSSETPHCHYPVLGTPQCCHPLLGTPVPLPLRGIPQCHHPCLGWRWNSITSKITSSQMTLWWIRCFCNYLQDNTQKGECCCCSSWWNFLYKGTSRQASGEISCINIDESSGRSASEAAQPNQDVPHGCRSLPSTSRDPMDVSRGMFFITALPMHMEECTAQNSWVFHLDTPSFHVLSRGFFIYLNFFLKFEPSK